eukprot:279029-Amphidinium_carterae.1
MAKKLVAARQPWQRVAGPAGAYLLVAARLQWQIVSVTEVVSHRGVFLDLLEVSPAFLKSEVQHATEVWTDRDEQKRRHDEPTEVWWHPLHCAVRSAKHPLPAACLEVIAAGGTWSQQRMHRHAMAEDDQCRACHSAAGTLFHRVMECEAWESERCRRLSHATREWVHMVGVPLLGAGIFECRVPLDRVQGLPSAEVHFKEIGVPWHQHGTVYTDGCSLQPADCQVRRAGWACVLTDAAGQTIAARYGTVPALVCPGQAAADAEDFAILMACCLTKGQLEVVSDCKAT